MVVFGMSSVSAAEINDAGDQGTLSEDEKGTVNDEMSEYPERPGTLEMLRISEMSELPAEPEWHWNQMMWKKTKG